jgi:hypothetical protein
MIPIKKGERTGTIEIPCPTRLLSYTVDLNPTLLRRGKKIEDIKIPQNTSAPILYHPDEDESLVLHSGELITSSSEVERCPHCGQKAVVAEVTQHHINSDPIIGISLSNPVSEDTLVPAKFGIFVPNIIRNYRAMILIDTEFALSVLLVALLPLVFPKAFLIEQTSFMLVVFAALGLVFLPMINYPYIKTYRWYKSIKSRLVKLPKPDDAKTPFTFTPKVPS